MTKKDSSLVMLGTLFLTLLLLQLSIQIPYTYDSSVIGAGFVNLVLTYVKIIVRAIFTSAFFPAVLALLPCKRLRLSCYILMAVLLGGLLSVELFLYSHHTQLYGYGMIQAIVGTNPQESQEYWSTIGALPLLAVVGRMALFAAIAYGITKSLNRGGGRWLDCLSVRKWRIPLSVFFIATTILLEIKPIQEAKVESQVNAGATVPLERMLWNTYGFTLNYLKLEDGVETMKTLNLGEISSSNLPPHNLVVIIGESLRRDYLHCYGYPLLNTPHLDSLVASGDMVLFDDVVCPVPGTVPSVTKMLSFQRNDNPGNNWYDYPPLLNVLKKAGYNLSWITNQESLGTYVLPITALTSFADRKKYIELRTSGDNYRHIFYDEAVLPHLAAEKQDSSTYNGVFIHLQGSHQRYASRFPDSFKRFRPEDLPVKRDADKDQIIADYVNSVYYNDYIVSEIIKGYSDGSSIVIYVPDHAEILYDDPRNPNYANHALLPQGVEIPFMVYLSPRIQKQSPELMEIVRNARSRKIMMDLLPNGICGLIGVEASFTDEQLNFFSDKYNNQRQRLVQGRAGETLLMP